jgi:hypothetical protein
MRTIRGSCSLKTDQPVALQDVFPPHTQSRNCCFRPLQVRQCNEPGARSSASGPASHCLAGDTQADCPGPLTYESRWRPVTRNQLLRSAVMCTSLHIDGGFRSEREVHGHSREREAVHSVYLHEGSTHRNARAVLLTCSGLSDRVACRSQQESSSTSRRRASGRRGHTRSAGITCIPMVPSSITSWAFFSAQDADPLSSIHSILAIWKQEYRAWQRSRT